jgi:hypothetical protein
MHVDDWDCDDNTNCHKQKNPAQAVQCRYHHDHHPLPCRIDRCGKESLLIPVSNFTVAIAGNNRYNS